MSARRYILSVRSSEAVAIAEQIGDTLPGTSFDPNRGQLNAPYNAKNVLEAAFVSLRVNGSGIRTTQCPEAATSALVTRLDAGISKIVSAPGMRSIVHKPGSEEAVAFADFAAPFQSAGIIESCERGFGLLRWPTGSGKSFGGICILASQHGTRGIIVTRATNRVGFAREIARYTNESVDLLEGITPRPLDPNARFVVLGWETLPAWKQTIIHSGPYAVLFDEIHKCRNRRRFTFYEDADGKHRKQNDNIASAALDLSRSASHGAVWGATATPIDDRVRDMWAPLDLIEPNGWGSWSSYAKRYCDGHINSYGGLEAKGKTNVDELRQRVVTITHDVPESVVMAQLPGADVIFTALSKQDQCGAAAFADEVKAAARDGATAVERSHAMRAATKKRPYILDKAEEVVSAGKRYAVFTGRRLDAERLALEISKRLAGVGLKDIAKHRVFMLHGGISGPARQRMIDEYGSPAGAAVIVGTTAIMGESINGLQCTNWATFAQIPMTPGELKQSMGRFPRFGQLERCTIELLWAEGDEFDERAVGRLIKKLPAIREAVGDVSMAGVETGFLGDGEAMTDSLFAKLTAAPIDDALLVDEV